MPEISNRDPSDTSPANAIQRRNPYVGPRAFREDEEKLFFGREWETNELYSLLAANRILLMYSPSGAGKSSLVEAGLRPRLRQKGFMVLPTVRLSVSAPSESASGAGSVGVGEDPRTVANRYIYSTLLSLQHDLPEAGADEALSDAQLACLTLNEYLEKRKPRSAETQEQSPKRVIIFDQLEEILTTYPTDLEGKRAFFDQVGAALDDPRLFALFVLREDYLAALEPYEVYLPTQLRNTFRLDFLGKAAARRAIQLPLNGLQPPVQFQDRAVEALLDNLSQVLEPGSTQGLRKAPGEYVEPVQLQVVCYRLYEKLMLAEHPEIGQIEEQDLGEAGDVDKALAEFYAEEVRRIAGGQEDDEWRLRDWIEKHLISASGARTQVIHEAERSAGLENDWIDGLVDAHVVRREKRRGFDWYELAHDRLVQPVLDDNKNWRLQHRSLLQRQALVWDEQGRPDGLLLSGQALQEAQEWAEKNAAVLAPAEKDLLSASLAAIKQEGLRQEAEQARQKAALQARYSSRLQLLTFVLTVLAIMAVILAVFAIDQYNRAKASEENAFARQLAAQAESIFATGSAKQTIAVLLAVKSMAAFPSGEAGDILQNKPLARPVAGMTYAGGVAAVAFSRDGRYVVSGGCDQPASEADCTEGSVRVWEAATGKQIARMIHKGWVNSVAFSADGKYVVSGSDDKTARVWEVASEKEISSMAYNEGGLDVAFSPDGKYVVSGGCDQTDDQGNCTQGSARVWEAATGKEIARMTHGAWVNSVAFSPDGKLVVSGSDDGTARVWDPASGKEIARMTHDGFVQTVAFSPDSQYVVSGGCDHQISDRVDCQKGSARVWEAATGKEIARTTHDGFVSTVAFSPDGKYVVSGSDDGTSKVWDVASGRVIGRMIQKGWVYDVAFSPDGRYVVSGGCDQNDEWSCFRGTARVWEAAGGAEIARINPDNWVWSVAFSPDGRYVVTGSLDGSARVWDPAGGKEIARMTHMEGEPAFAFSPDGKYVVSGGCDQNDDQGNCTQGSARVWEAASGKEIARMTHDANVGTVAFSPDGRYVVSGDDHGNARVWEAASGKEVAQMTQNDGQVWAVAFSPDGKLVVSSGCDQQVDDRTKCTLGSARVWEAATGKEIARMTHGANVGAAAFSPDGKYVVTGSDDGTARVWEIASGKEISRMTHGWVIAVAFSPDSKYVVSAGCDHYEGDWTCSQGSARVWDAATGKEISRMTHATWVFSVAFSPDGKYVVSGSDDGTARVWEAASGKEVARTTHDDKVEKVAFSPDGKYVVSGSDDGSARVWDAMSGQVIVRMNHTSVVRNVAFTPDSRFVVTGSDDGSVRVWLWRPADLIERACERLTRNLSLAEWQQYIGNSLPYQAICPGLPGEPAPELTPTP